MRDKHFNKLIKLGQVRFPTTVDEVTANGDLCFSREGDVYVAIRVLKPGHTLHEIKDVFSNDLFHVIGNGDTQLCLPEPDQRDVLAPRRPCRARCRTTATDTQSPSPPKKEITFNRQDGFKAGCPLGQRLGVPWAKARSLPPDCTKKYLAWCLGVDLAAAHHHWMLAESNTGPSTHVRL